MLGLPSASMTQPSGTLSPREAATSSLPPAAAAVEMSMKKGPSRFDGIAMQIGLVPRRASRPPKGATLFGERPESAVTSAIMSARAAISG